MTPPLFTISHGSELRADLDSWNLAKGYLYANLSEHRAV
jgi:hypothetical protein